MKGFLRWLGGIPARMWFGALRVGDLRLWVLIGAGPIITLCAAALVWIVWKGGWVDLQEKQLNIIGFTLFGTLALLALTFTKIAGVSTSVRGPLGLGLDINARDDGRPAVTTETTTTTTVTPPPAPGQPEVHE